MSSFEVAVLFVTSCVVCGFAGYYWGWSRGAAWMRSYLRGP